MQERLFRGTGFAFVVGDSGGTVRGHAAVDDYFAWRPKETPTREAAESPIPMMST